MSGSSVQILAQAHAYIESGNLEDAESLLRSLLEQDPENTDAWWLLAHSVRDAAAAREALDQVLRLDPNDQQALSLLSALDDRFPSEAPSGGRRLRLSLPRIRRPRFPSLLPGDGFGSYGRPVSFTLFLIIVVIGGWFLLRHFGFELVQTTPTPSASSDEVAQAVQTGDTAGQADITPVTESELTISDATTEILTPASQGAEAGIQDVPGADQTGPGEPDAAADEGPQTTDREASGELPAAGSGGAVSPAPAIATAPPGTTGEPGTVGEESANVTATPLPVPIAVPTYPFPTQTDAAEFLDNYVREFTESGLYLIADTPLLEGSGFGSTALAAVCLNEGPGLRDTINDAMEVMAGFARQLLNSAPALGVKVLDCADNNSVQRIIAVELDVALQWSEGKIGDSAFYASWAAVG